MKGNKEREGQGKGKVLIEARGKKGLREGGTETMQDNKRVTEINREKWAVHRWKRL